MCKDLDRHVQKKGSSGIVEASQLLQIASGPGKLDDLPTPGTPHEPFFAPFRLLLRLLRLGVANKTAEITEALTKLSSFPELHAFVDWVPPLSDRLCGCVEISEGMRINCPLTGALSVRHQDVYRALGHSAWPAPAPQSALERALQPTQKRTEDMFSQTFCAEVFRTAVNVGVALWNTRAEHLKYPFSVPSPSGEIDVATERLCQDLRRPVMSETAWKDALVKARLSAVAEDSLRKLYSVHDWIKERRSHPQNAGQVFMALQRILPAWFDSMSPQQQAALR